MSSSARARCQQFQEKAAKRRDREFWHQQRWGQQVEYYQRFEKVNAQLESWTSPRYYEANTELVQRLKKERDKREGLERRREKLRRLLAEDEASHEVEMMMGRAKTMERERVRVEDVPTEALKDLNIGMRIAEDERQRSEAELKLYHQWRRDNPAVRDAERSKAKKDIKLSWLDQQIEKRMAKEKEQEECKRFLKKRDENIQKQKQEDQTVTEEIQKKNEQLKLDLLKQIEEINLKQKESETLKQSEEEELRKQTEVLELQDKLKQQDACKRNKEVAIYNLKQHKLRLKNLSRQIQENLNEEQALVAEIIKSRAAEQIQDSKTKREVKTALDEFLKFTREQRDLEKKRQSHLDFIFDSEAKLAFENQKQIWDNEEASRRTLLKDVLDTIQRQIDENVKRNQENQRELVRERERLLESIEAYEKEMEENKRIEGEKKIKIKEEIERQMQEKRSREKRLKDLERKNYDVELENMKKEEERLKREIVKIQSSHAPMRYVKKKPWY